MKQDILKLITELNTFIEKYTLKKILTILGCFFIGLISLNMVTTYFTPAYDCSENKEIVVNKIVECKQQYIDQDIKRREISLQEYKVQEQSSLEKLRLRLSKMDISSQNILSELSMSKTELFKNGMSDCYSQIRELMCKRIK
jgi:hypothetical protein